MICPFCIDKALVSVTTVSGTVERCPACMGFFVPWAMLAKFSEDPARFTQVLTEGVPLMFPTGRICPHCHGRLCQGRLPGYEVIMSLCVTCKLIWTDPADLESLDPLMAAALRTQIDKPSVPVVRKVPPKPVQPGSLQNFFNPDPAQNTGFPSLAASTAPTLSASDPSGPARAADLEKHKEALGRELRESLEKRESELIRRHEAEMQKAREALDQTLRETLSATKAEQTQRLASLQKNVTDLERGWLAQETHLQELKTRLEMAENQRGHLSDKLGKREEDLAKRHAEEIKKTRDEIDKAVQEKISAVKAEYADFIETLQKYIMGLEQTKLGQETDIQELKKRLESMENQRAAIPPAPVKWDAPPLVVSPVPTPAPAPAPVPTPPKAPPESPPSKPLPETPKAVPIFEKPAVLPSPAPVPVAAQKRSVMSLGPTTYVAKKPSILSAFIQQMKQLWTPPAKKPAVKASSETPKPVPPVPVPPPPVVEKPKPPPVEKPVVPAPVVAEDKPVPAPEKPGTPSKPTPRKTLMDQVKAFWSPAPKKPAAAIEKPSVTAENDVPAPVLKETPPAKPAPQPVPTPQAEPAVQRPLKPVVVKKKRETPWIELAVAWTPRVLPVIVFVIAGLVEEDWGQAFLWAAAAWAVSVMIRLWRMYPTKFKETTLAELSALPIASLKSGVPVLLKGRLENEPPRSTPIVFTDATGSLPLNLLGPLDLIPRLFGLISSGQFPKDDFELKGWYRRSKTPFIEVVEARQEKTLRKSLVKPLRWAGAVAVLFFAVLLLFVIE